MILRECETERNLPRKKRERRELTVKGRSGATFSIKRSQEKRKIVRKALLKSVTASWSNKSSSKLTRKTKRTKRI